MEKRTKLVFLAVPWLGLLAITWVAWSHISFPPDVQAAAHVPAGQIYQRHTVGQTFTAPYGGLDRVSLFLASYARANWQPVIFLLRRDTPTGPVVTSETFAADTVQDNAWRIFTLDPLPDSAGQTFYLALESPASRPGDAITVWRSEGDRHPDGTAWRDGQPLDGDLAFAARLSWHHRRGSAHAPDPRSPPVGLLSGVRRATTWPS